MSANAKISVCLLSNAAYAAPTAVVARLIARHDDPAIDKIYFVWLDQADPPAILTHFLGACGTRLVRIPGRLMSSLDGFSSGRLPSAVFARMLLAKILSAETIDRFVYLDGDIDITGPIGKLATIDLPGDYLATADGYQDVIVNPDPDKRRDWARHTEGLGLRPGDKYFNNGVIVTTMANWETVGPLALEYFRTHRERCRHLDQDALNAVCRERRAVLSPKYNFQRAYFHTGVAGIVKPRIIHFHGEWKPWYPTPGMWTWASRKPFAASLGELSELWRLTPPRNLPSARRLGHRLRGIGRALKERSLKERHRAEFLAYTKQTHFVDGA